jgi:hypothetical protein
MQEDQEGSRSIAELIETLDSDYLKCYQHVIRQLNVAETTPDGSIAETDFESRQLVRAAFAYIEGTTYVLKMSATLDADEHGIELSPQQQHFIFEADFDLNDKGEVFQKSARIPMAKNIRFAFAILAEANGVANPLRIEPRWWHLLKDSIKVRDRLMHPRWPADLDVSPKEVITLIQAKAGFDEELQAILTSRAARPKNSNSQT